MANIKNTSESACALSVVLEKFWKIIFKSKFLKFFFYEKKKKKDKRAAIFFLAQMLLMKSLLFVLQEIQKQS